MPRTSRRYRFEAFAKTFGAAVCLLVAANTCIAQSRMSSQGAQLVRFLDGLDIEHRWLISTAVDWETGEPKLGEPRSLTHCSAFVAAACERLGVYILRPPEHSQVLLANAQQAWLKDGTVGHQWRSISSAAAQGLANQGKLVIASYANPRPDAPGHIAIVRPGETSVETLRSCGPQVIQAGITNSRSISLKAGFSHHPGAWDEGKILFFAHPISSSRLQAAVQTQNNLTPRRSSPL